MKEYTTIKKNQKVISTYNIYLPIIEAVRRARKRKVTGRIEICHSFHIGHHDIVYKITYINANDVVVGEIYPHK